MAPASAASWSFSDEGARAALDQRDRALDRSRVSRPPRSRSSLPPSARDRRVADRDDLTTDTAFVGECSKAMKSTLGELSSAAVPGL